MKKIHKLSELVVANIAAGEVIERPSYAVKELVENALDAKAVNITVSLEDAGLTLLRVTDDGEGMSKEDLKESWKPHTTSKIRELEDLHTTKSFGFRGEALSSLAAVSTLTIQSRPANSPTGYSISVERGLLIGESSVGMPYGTTVTAEHLFAHIPARKKFMKSIRTELRLCVDIINNYALCYPSVQFMLIHGKKTLLYYPATHKRAERVEQIMGEDVFPLLIPITTNDTYLSIEGFIAKPQLNARSTAKQYLFINSRMVRDGVVSSAVKESYGTMLESATYPVFVLFADLPPGFVDINVHPRKEEVRFANGQYIFQTVKQAVTETLASHNLTFQNLSWKRSGAGLTGTVAGKSIKEAVLQETGIINVSRVFVQYNNLYIIVTSPEGIQLIDQHAAHERILFAKLVSTFGKKAKLARRYALPAPLALRCTARETILLVEYRDTLAALGFVVKDTLVTHVPDLFRDRDIPALIRDILEDIEGQGSPKSVDTASREMLSYLACRAAVKAGDPLTTEQMQMITDQLEKTPDNATCPHGRPTKILLTLKELHGLFHRH